MDLLTLPCLVARRPMIPRSTSEGPLTLSINVYICVLKNNRINGKKTQMQRMSSIPILCININNTIDTMLKFDANTDVNVNIDAQEERTLTAVPASLISLP